MKYLLSVIAILWGINVYAQLSPAPQGLDNYKCIDTTRFEIHYSFKFKNHSSQKQYNEDRRVIQVGRSVIKDYSEIMILWQQRTLRKDYQQATILILHTLVKYTAILWRKDDMKNIG